MPRTEPQGATGARQTLLPLFAVVAVDAIGAGILLPLLPLYARDFGASPVMIGLLLACFSLCQFVSAPILGIASDRLGRKRLLVVSQIGTCASFLLLGAAHSLLILFAARILDGLTSGNIAIAAAYASDNSDAGARREAIGVVSAAMGVGTMIGPALGGMLAPFGTSVPFIAAAGISLASIVASVTLLPPDRRHEAREDVLAAEGIAVPPNRLLSQLRALAASPGVKQLLVLLSIFYLAFGLFTSQLALVLNARFQWHGEPFGPVQIGVVLTAASIVTIAVQLTLMRSLAALVGDLPLTAVAFALLASGFIMIGSGHSLPALATAVLAVALGAALIRPALMSALSLAVPSHSQGAAMGITQALGSLINIAAPVAGGLMIQTHRFAIWGGTMGLLAFGGAAATILISAGRKYVQSVRQ